MSLELSRENNFQRAERHLQMWNNTAKGTPETKSKFRNEKFTMCCAYHWVSLWFTVTSVLSNNRVVRTKMTHAFEVFSSSIDVLLPAVFHLVKSLRKFMGRNWFQDHSYSVLELLHIGKSLAPEDLLEVWEQPKVHQGQIRRVGWRRKSWTPVSTRHAQVSRALWVGALLWCKRTHLLLLYPGVQSPGFFFLICSLNLPKMWVYTNLFTVQWVNSKWTTPVSSKNTHSIAFFCPHAWMADWGWGSLRVSQDDDLCLHMGSKQ